MKDICANVAPAYYGCVKVCYDLVRHGKVLKVLLSILNGNQRMETSFGCECKKIYMKIYHMHHIDCQDSRVFGAVKS